MKKTYKPILFSTEMVKAILDGRKTQTRRIIKKPMLCDTLNYAFENSKEIQGNSNFLNQAKYQIGNILWVREKFEYFGANWSPYDDDLEMCGNVIFNYYATANKDLKEIIVKNGIAEYAFSQIDKGWKPSIHMPKEAARIFLEVTNVRVERLRDISEEDAYKEGFGPVISEKYPAPGKFINHLNKHHMFCAVDSFATMWIKLNGTGAWKANPWVWVYEFKVVEKTKDFLYE